MPTEVSGGRIPITLGGRELYLEPSLAACIEISRFTGGLQAAVERCSRFDFETITRVIGLGLVYDGKRLNPRQIENDLPEDIFKAGVYYCSAKAIEFITIVGNGGKPPEPDEDEGEGDDSPLAG